MSTEQTIAAKSKETIIYEFSLILYRVCNEFKKCNPSEKGIKLIEQSDYLIRQYSNPLNALRVQADTTTVGSIISEAISLHELNPAIVEKELRFPKGVLLRLMNDEHYTNSIPIIIFKNLLLSLHIPFSKIEPAILPTFFLLISKETPNTISKKPASYQLFENEEAVTKYTNRLRELMQTQQP